MNKILVTINIDAQEGTSEKDVYNSLIEWAIDNFRNPAEISVSGKNETLRNEINKNGVEPKEKKWKQKVMLKE